MKVLLEKSLLKGSVTLPSSKSYTHRALFCAFFLKGKYVIHNPLICDDTIETINILKSLGSRISIRQNKIIIDSSLNKKDKKYPFYQSATTFRMIYPYLCLIGEDDKIILSDALRKRISEKELNEVKNQIKNDDIIINTSFSSQIVSGLILLLIISNKKIITKVSSSYIKMTIEAMLHFGLTIKKENDTYFLEKKEDKTNEIFIDSDFSNGAFFMVLSLYNKGLNLLNIKSSLYQGDIKIIKFLNEMGVDCFIENGCFLVRKIDFKDSIINLSDNLDLAPTLAALAFLSEKEVTFINLDRLKIKESDRLESIFNILEKSGALVTKTNSSITIRKGTFVKEANLSSFNDHRIVMMIIILLEKISKIVVDDFDAINKSMIGFEKEYLRLGGKITKL